MSSEGLLSVELSETQFNEISDLVKSMCGINLHEGKKELVKARLNRRLRKLRLPGFAEYIKHVRDDASRAELTAMIDALSTNQTSFFREADHFEYLATKVIPRMTSKAATTRRRLRVWSAGCSSGEEAYSIAITACEAIPNIPMWDASILATDISTRVLARARQGSYEAEGIEGIPSHLLVKYFRRIKDHPNGLYQVKESLRELIHFGRLNLMDAWPMRGPFDAIFCRNVMIYFDKPTQGELVQRFWELLAPGGTLFIGHSESLTGIRHQFQYVQPTVYEKP